MIDVHVYIEKGVIHKVSLFPIEEKTLKWRFFSDSPTVNVLVEQWLQGYAKKNIPDINLPFNWENITPFHKQVLEALREIPFGSTLTYSEIAAIVGREKAARAVGGACHRNPFPLFVPCHRVIAVGGSLRGFAGGLQMKKTLLDFEDSKTHK